MTAILKKSKYFFLSFFNFYFEVKLKNNLRVLAYHDVKEKNHFEKHINYLLNSGYTFIDVYALSDHLYHGADLPDKPILITFDDGDPTVLTNGLPILKKYGLPSVLFVITELINTNKAFWWDRIRINLRKKGEDSKSIAQSVAHAKKTDNAGRLRFLSEFQELEGRQLTREELFLLQENKMSIGNHSHTHPMFDRCTETEIENELMNSRQMFQNWGLNDFSFFAYPNGNSNEAVQKQLFTNGIRLAFLFDHAINKKKIDPLNISRIRVNSDTGLKEFKVRVSGLQSFLLGLKKQKT
jgi:peptidoglycan/xylan/chitin deacetylase (PgdA/CDA1 family)